MIKRYIVRIENTPENKANLAAGWGLIRHRHFAKYKITKDFTTFWFTKAEYNEYNEILNSLALLGSTIRKI